MEQVMAKSFPAGTYMVAGDDKPRTLGGKVEVFTRKEETDSYSFEYWAWHNVSLGGFGSIPKGLPLLKWRVEKSEWTEREFNKWIEWVEATATYPNYTDCERHKLWDFMNW